MQDAEDQLVPIATLAEPKSPPTLPDGRSRPAEITAALAMFALAAVLLASAGMTLYVVSPFDDNSPHRGGYSQFESQSRLTYEAAQTNAMLSGFAGATVGLTAILVIKLSRMATVIAVMEVVGVALLAAATLALSIHDGRLPEPAFLIIHLLAVTLAVLAGVLLMRLMSAAPPNLSEKL